jgi:hypothetical protein
MILFKNLACHPLVRRIFKVIKFSNAALFVLRESVFTRGQACIPIRSGSKCSSIKIASPVDCVLLVGFECEKDGGGVGRFDRGT